VFFISRDQDIILKSFEKYLPATIYRRMTLVGSATGGALFGYLKSQLILMFIAAGIAFIGLQILGVPYAFLIAVLVGIADLLPLVGPGTIFLPWIVWEVVNGNHGFAIALLVLYAVVTVVRQVVQPKIVGDSIGLHPLETLIALFVGLRLMGVLGLILGPIIWVVFKASWNAGVFKRDC
jgi:sporulation integral membrane protein YtvI